MVFEDEDIGKIGALADYLGEDPGSVTVSTGKLYSFKAFYCGPERAFLVLTEDEADLAAERAVRDRLWLIALESVFSYFEIDCDPETVPEKISGEEIRKINSALNTLLDKTCNIEKLSEKMLFLGNRANILADYDQKEISHKGYLIFRLF